MVDHGLLIYFIFNKDDNNLKEIKLKSILFVHTLYFIIRLFSIRLNIFFFYFSFAFKTIFISYATK